MARTCALSPNTNRRKARTDDRQVSPTDPANPKEIPYEGDTSE